jgi:hypothetical protein
MIHSSWQRCILRIYFVVYRDSSPRIEVGIFSTAAAALNCRGSPIGSFPQAAPFQLAPRSVVVWNVSLAESFALATKVTAKGPCFIRGTHAAIKRLSVRMMTMYEQSAAVRESAIALVTDP